MKSLLFAALLGATQPFLVAAQSVLNPSGCVSTNYVSTMNYFPEQTSADYSTKWSVVYNNHYKTVSVTLASGIRTYQLIQCFTDAAQNTLAINAAPACESSSGCFRYQLPIRASTVHDPVLLGFFDELGSLALVDAGNIVAPVSPCYEAKTNFNPVAAFTTVANQNINVPINTETTLLARAEYVEFISIFINREGWANYIVGRFVQSYEIQTALLRSKVPSTLSKPNVVWIQSISSTGVVSFRNDAWLKQVMDDALVTLSSFGSADRTTSDNTFATYMVEADIVVVETPSLTSSSAMIQRLGLSTSGSYKFLTPSRTYIYQVDKIKSALSVSSDFLEHAAVAPDLLLSDVLSAVSHHSTRVNVAPWNTVKRTYLRFASDFPKVPAALTDQHRDQCSIPDGRVRTDDINDIRASILVGLKSESVNPQTAIVTYDPQTDYFPQKVKPEHSGHFSVNYHLNWKLVRNLNRVAALGTNSHRADTILIMKGTPAPNANILPWAVRVMIPVERVGFQSSTDSALALLLKKTHTTTAARAPIACIIHLRSTGKIINFPFSDPSSVEAISDVVFTGSSTGSTKNVISTATSDLGLLGRAEWLFFMATFYNLEVSASTTFAEIRTRYYCVLTKGDARNAQSTKPRVVELGYSTFGGVSWTFSRASYQTSAIAAAGGIVANNDPQNSAYLPNLSTGQATRFTDIAAVKAALRDVDIIIDVTYIASNTGATPSTFAQVLSNVGLAASDVAGKKWFRYDKTMDDGGFSDYFARATVEVDAYLEDLISMFHPESLPQHVRFFYRDMVNNEGINRVTGAECPYQGTGDLPVSVSSEISNPVAHLSVCVTTCAQRYNEQYCREDNCIWSNGLCIAITPAPVVVPAPVTPSDLVPAGVCYLILSILFFSFQQKQQFKTGCLWYHSTY